MRHVMRIIFVLAAVLLLAGIVLGGAGFLTGASPERIAELLFGGWDGLRAVIGAQLEWAMQTVGRLAAYL